MKTAVWGALALVAATAFADERGDARAGAQVFVEPAASQRLVVVTPQVSARVAVRPWLGIAVDYSADIVTGATPRTYGAPDAISAATNFSDVRSSAAAHVTARAGRFTFDGGYRFGIENDYRSHVVQAGARIDLFRRNTTLAGSYAHNFDSVCDLDNGALPSTLRQPLGTSEGCFGGAPGLVSEPLAIDAAELSVTQVVTPRLVAALVGSYEHLAGFQSNPYRRVRLDGGALLAQESHPQKRDRGALALRGRYAVPRAHGALGLDLRLYRDSWALASLTVEATWEQHLGERLILRLRARYYQQGRALFYRDAGEADSYERAGPVGAYFTGDRELAPFADLLVGARMVYTVGHALRRLHDLEAALRIDLIKVFALTPEPPNAARTRGVVDALYPGLAITGRF